MKKDLEVLKMRDVPEHLDIRIMTAAKLAASGNARRNSKRRISLMFGGIAAAAVAGFAIFFSPQPDKTTHFEVQYQALNDLSYIEQEAFALAAELNCQRVYALDNTASWENPL